MNNIFSRSLFFILIDPEFIILITIQCFDFKGLLVIRENSMCLINIITVYFNKLKPLFSFVYFL